MELIDAMRTTHACRAYAPTPVPDDVLAAAVEAARFGPQGGNRQPVRFVVVRDAERKRQLGEWYRVPWRAYLAQVRAGNERIGHASFERALTESDAFAQAFGEHPAIVVVCAELAALHATDTELGRLSIVGGASIYPTMQNFCLALRDQGVASTITTLLVAYEEQVRALLAIPDGFATAAHVVVGYPAKPFPTRLTRLPVHELVFGDTFGVPLGSD